MVAILEAAMTDARLNDAALLDFLAKNLGNDLIFTEEPYHPHGDNDEQGWYWGPIATDQWYSIEDEKEHGPFPDFRTAIINAMENYDDGR